MKVRQSDLKTWQKCPLQYRHQHVAKLPREMGGSAVFGSIIHDCVMWMELNQDISGAVDRFLYYWSRPQLMDPEYVIDYYERGRNWKKFNERGPKMLTRWWHIIQWETDHVLAREFPFEVPIGNGHILQGTVDKVMLRYHAATDEWVVLISDYKTNAKAPTYNYLEEDLQFSAYSYASLQPEFWVNMVPGQPGKGLALFEKFRDWPRRGEWVHLEEAKRMDAGPREARHYNRLEIAVNNLAASVQADIFVPNISGEACRYCEFRKVCGLPEIEEDVA